jgi:hypothetical protein
MSFTPIKTIKNNIFSHDEKKISMEVKQVMGYCKSLLRDVKQEAKNFKQIEYIKKLIMEHMYIIYYCFKCVGIVKLTSNLNIDIYDKEIEDYLENFYNDSDICSIFEILKKKAKEEKNNDEIYFYENMIDKFSKNKKNPELLKEIKKIQNEIYNKLENDEQIKIPNKLKKHIYYENNENNDKDVINMNRHVYYDLQRKTEESNIRKEIENLYFSKSEKCLGLLEKLSLLRSDYSNKNGFKTYFNYTKRREKYDSIEIKNLIDDLIIKIDNRAKKETRRIYKKIPNNSNNKKKVDFHDFIYYYELMCSECFFSLKETIEIMIEVVRKFFYIELKRQDSKDFLWDKNIQTYQAFDSENKFLGNIFFDMSFNENKKIMAPICIHICHYYVDLNGEKYNTNVAILGNYHDKTREKCIKHADIISLFREMGNAIQFLLYKTMTGNMNYRDDFYLLTSKIMEYIAWEKSTLIKICHNDKELVEHLLFTRFIDFGNSIKLRCVNAYFDHIIHNSEELIKDLKNYGKCSGEIFKNLYKQIYKNIFSSQKDIYNINIDSIHPIVVLQEINGSETSLYENIIVEILSYSVFNLIKLKEGKKYTKILSRAGSDKFKDSLNKFVKKIGDNYTLYLQELIGYNEIDTELNMQIKNVNSVNNSTDTGNYFDDRTLDQEDIIIIDRKLELN